MPELDILHRARYDVMSCSCEVLLMLGIRASLACVLLYSGCVWLARTTNMNDLILNSIALAGLLDLDEMLSTGRRGCERWSRDEGVTLEGPQGTMPLGWYALRA